MIIKFFEDEALSRFHPLTLTRPLDDLRCGAFTIREKWLKILNTTYYTRTERSPVTEYYPQNLPQEQSSVYWINSRCLPDAYLAAAINDLNSGETLYSRDVIVAAKTDKLNAANIPDFQSFEKKVVESVQILTGATDLFTLNGDQINSDSAWYSFGQSPSPGVSPHALIDNPENISIGDEVVIEPFVFTDTTEGPVIIEDGAEIMANSVIHGPAVIGKGSVVKAGTRLYKDTTLGPVCKVGGEVSNIIMQGFSNKAHDGYLGNSVIGEWCNLGADTTSSNLKNNYSLIRLRDWNTQKPYDSGLQFCGVLMGDHTKTSINTMINTGSQFGVSCNVIAGKFPPSFLNSFSWLNSDKIYIYQIEKALETARKVMARRNFELTSEYERMLTEIYQLRE